MLVNVMAIIGAAVVVALLIAGAVATVRRVEPVLKTRNTKDEADE